MAEYLVEVLYASDAERKRAEYVIDRYRGRLSIRRPRGMLLIVEADAGSVEALARELAERLGPGRVKVYRLEPRSVGLEAEEVRVEARLRLSPPEALGAMAAIMARLRGALVGTSGGERLYRLSMRGGIVEARVAVVEYDNGTRVVVRLRGLGRPLERAVRRVVEEFSLLGGEVAVNGGPARV